MSEREHTLAATRLMRRSRGCAAAGGPHSDAQKRCCVFKYLTSMTMLSILTEGRAFKSRAERCSSHVLVKIHAA